MQTIITILASMLNHDNSEPIEATINNLRAVLYRVLCNTSDSVSWRDIIGLCDDLLDMTRDEQQQGNVRWIEQNRRLKEVQALRYRAQAAVNCLHLVEHVATTIRMGDRNLPALDNALEGAAATINLCVNNTDRAKTECSG